MALLSIVMMLALMASPRHDDTVLLSFASITHAEKAYLPSGCRTDVSGACCASLHCSSGIPPHNSIPQLPRQVPVPTAYVEQSLAFQAWGRLERPPKT